MSDLNTLATEIKAGVAGLARTVKRGLTQAKELGDKLRAAKALCETTGVAFMLWVRENCELGYKQASNYILVATHWDEAPADELQDWSINKFVSMVSGKVAPKVKKARSRQKYTSEYVARMATSHGVTGDVAGFLARFGVPVEAGVVEAISDVAVDVQAAEGQAVAA